MKLNSTCTDYFCVYRLYVDFTMETIIASAFGESVDSQTAGEGSELVTATNNFIDKFQECLSSSAEDITVFLCEL